MPFSFLWIIMTTPAALVVAVGLAVRSKANSQDTAARWQQFMFATLVILLVLVIIPFEPIRNLGFIVIPSLIGVLATFLLSLTNSKFWSNQRKRTTSLFTLGISALIVSLGAVSFPNAMFIIVPAFIVALTWKIWGWRIPGRLILFLLLAIFIVAEFDLIPSILSLNSPELFQTTDTIAQIVLPIMGITITARLTHSIFASDRMMPAWSIVLRLLFALLPLVAIAYQILKAVPFDFMTDGLAAAILTEIASFACVASAMLLAWSLPGNRRWVALGFALIITLLLQSLSAIDFQLSPVAMTKQRAEQVHQAILRYHAQEGKYPNALVDLSPGYLWHIPEPIMLRTNNAWCYEGGKDYYRLGYFFHEGFSAPASVRIQGSAGTPPNPEWQCDRDVFNYNWSLGVWPSQIDGETLAFLFERVLPKTSGGKKYVVAQPVQTCLARGHLHIIACGDGGTLGVRPH